MAIVEQRGRFMSHNFALTGAKGQGAYGFTVKVPGKPTFGFLFKDDGGEVFPRYLIDADGNAIPLATAQDQAAITNTILALVTGQL